MSASISHIPRTLAKLREQGWVAEKVEQWVSFGGGEAEERGVFRPGQRGKGFKRDFMGFADILGLDGAPGVHAVQVCARSGLSGHLKKIDSEERAKTWLLSGNRITIWTWEKNGRFWQGREVPLCYDGGRIATIYERRKP